MQIDLVNIYFIVVCCVLPFCGLVITLLSLSIRNRLRYRQQILRDLEGSSYGDRNPLPANIRRLAAVYVIISLAVLGGLFGLMLISIAYYLGLPLIANIDIKILGVVSFTVLLIAVLMSVLLAIISKKVYKIKE
jgi:hypothetical protein